MSQPPSENKKRLSPYSLGGLVLLLVGVLAILLAALFDLPAVPTTIIRSLGAISLIINTVLGYLAIRQIRGFPEQYYGMRLGIFDLLFTPIIVLDFLLFILGWALLGWLTSSSLVPLVWLVIVILIDYGVIRLTWNRAIQ